MATTVRVADLQVGMFVQLAGTWLSHPFLRDRFLISSERQLDRLRRSGIGEVAVDFDKSDPGVRPAPPAAAAESAPAPAWTPENLVPAPMLEAIHDHRLEPERKSRIVYEHSREMMARLLEVPTAENIQASKKAIASVTEMILADGATASSLLRITSHDVYTYTHSVNVGVLSILIARSLFARRDAHDLLELGASFFLHDLGKVGVDQAVINKPGKLTPGELRRMRRHPELGYQMLREAGVLSEECAVVVMQHHERWDGAGYPNRLAGEDIHIYGRICCAADVFDALTAQRSYKPGMTHYEALTTMRGPMAGHFDSKVLRELVFVLT